MKKLLFIVASILLIFSSCAPSKIEEGEIEYMVTYPHVEISGLMEALLPETMQIVFKGTKIKMTISKGNIFCTEIISDEADNSIEMRLDFGDEKFYTILDENDLSDLMASQPKYDITSLNKQDSINGMYATSYKVSCANDTIPRQDAWFTQDLSPQKAYWFTSYENVVGFPLTIDVERYGVLMHVESLSKTERKVKDSEFERDPELTEISFEEYEAHVQELFDLLMN